MQVEHAIELLGHDQQGLVGAGELMTATSSSSLARAVRSGRVVQVRPRVYSLVSLPALPRQLVTEKGPAAEWVAAVRAGMLSVAGSAATGRTAAALRGWGLLTEPVSSLDLALPHGTHSPRRAGVSVVQLRNLLVEPLLVLADTRPLNVTDPVTTLIRCCLDLPLIDAVVVCDSALRVGALTLEQLTRAAVDLRGVRQAARVRAVLVLVDADSGSVLETALRVRLVQAGLTDLTTQVVITDAQGRHVIRADFCFVAQRLIIETDGAQWHTDRERDRRIDNAVAELGWRMLRFGWADVVHDPAEVVRQVRAACAAVPGSEPSSEALRLGQPGARRPCAA